jgi:VanZ family protein
MPGIMIPRVPMFIDLYAPDKLVHLFIFGVFVYSLLKGFVQNPVLSFRIASFYSLLISIAFGGITELLQVYIFTYRQGSIYDFIADGIGSLVGYLVCSRWKRLVIKR